MLSQHSVQAASEDTQPRPKILAISYLFPNPVAPNHGIFVFNRLNALAKYADIKVINPIPWSPVHRFIGNYRDNDQIPTQVTRGALEIFHPRFLSIPRVLKSVEVGTYQRAVQSVVDKELSAFDFDLIDLHWTFPDLPTGVALSDQRGKPFLTTLRGMEAFHIHDGDIRQRLVADCLPKARFVIALSRELQQQGIEVGCQPESTAVIRNGVDSQGFYHIDKSAARSELGIDQGEKFIVMVGALIRRKGFDLVIEALAKLQQSTPDLRLRIVGSEGHEGDFRAELNQLIDRHGLQDRVVFQGAVENHRLKYWYNAADVFCLASRGEGSPNVLTEALACGCPAVAADVGAVREIMESEQDLGFVFASEDVTVLAEQLAASIALQTDRQAQAQRFGKYDWDWCAREVLKRYQQALSSTNHE